jgi:hypothetical protein
MLSGRILLLLQQLPKDLLVSHIPHFIIHIRLLSVSVAEHLINFTRLSIQIHHQSLLCPTTDP